nr:bidirectional sugar transporter NEC1-like [Ipomoea batatas]
MHGKAKLEEKQAVFGVVGVANNVKVELKHHLVHGVLVSTILTSVAVLVFNIGVLGLIVVLTYLLSEGDKRVKIVGWILSVIAMKVIRTKSVEYMPFNLSLFLTLCAVVWLLYGICIRDFYIALILYAIYRDRKTAAVVAPNGEIQGVSIVVDATAAEMLQKVTDDGSDEIQETTSSSVVVDMKAVEMQQGKTTTTNNGTVVPVRDDPIVATRN